MLHRNVLLLALCCTLGGAACETKRTEMVVGVVTDLAAPGGLDEVDMQVLRDGVTLFHKSWIIPGNAGSQWELPNALGLTSEDGSPRVDITLTGMLGGNPMVTRDATVNLLHEQTLFMRMALVQSCGSNYTCMNPTDTCIEGRCKPRLVDVRTLPVYIQNMEFTVNCSSTTFVDTGTHQPVPMDPSSGGCTGTQYCQEGTCYSMPAGMMSGDGGMLTTGWQQLSTAPAVTPAPRNFAGASQVVADTTHNTVLLWGGTLGDGSPAADTWSFDGIGWTRLASDIGGSDALGPSAYDRARGVIVTYREPSGDLVEFQYASALFAALPTGQWMVKAAGSAQGSPPPRQHARLAYDAMHNVTVLYGGMPAAGSCSQVSTAFCDDTWLWNGTAWSPATVVPPPAARRDGALEYSDALHKVILFGGRGDAGTLSDTWSWDGSTWTSLAASFPNGVIFDVGGLLSYDANRSRLVWLNGTRAAYLFDGTNWGGGAYYVDPNAPLLGNFSGAYLKTAGAVVAFGGTDPRGAPLAQTWLLNIP